MLPDSHWEEIRTIIEPRQRRRRRPLRLIMSGIIYLLYNGCKWRGLPPQYGDYKLVWYYYNKWMMFGVLEALLYKLNRKLRQNQGRSPSPSLVIIDAQSVKTTAGTSEQKGYDGGKRVTGRKRHLAVDSSGNVMAAGVTAASVHDKPGATSLKEEVEDLGTVKKVLVDGAYKGLPPFTDKGRIEWQLVERKATGGRFKVLPKRWVVERTFAWLQNFRRLAKDYEKTILMAKAMLLMSAVVISLNKLST